MSSHHANWSNDSQTHTQICILESQIEVKGNQVNDLKEKNDLLELEKMQLKDEIDRLNKLVQKLSGNKELDLLDRFK
tara:strand:- start:339 stop:569 length:231 start_codon:yes stop_codon:yes gene_type:complete